MRLTDLRELSCALRILHGTYQISKKISAAELRLSSSHSFSFIFKNSYKLIFLLKISAQRIHELLRIASCVRKLEFNALKWFQLLILVEKFNGLLVFSKFIF